MMKQADFQAGCPGRLEPTSFTETVAGPTGTVAQTVAAHGFVPNPLPPSLDLGRVLEKVWPGLSAADGNLRELRGAAHRIPNPHLLTGVFARRDAILSSKIEDTIASAEELALFDFDIAEPERRNEIREVRNYVAAIDRGLKSRLPICNRLILELHRVLMRGDRGRGASPGRFRTTQNAIAAGGLFRNARFIPPPPQYMTPCMNDLEAHINAKNGGLPLLLRIALIHYQFETIHPFLDGNGRIGRLLVTLLLCREGRLGAPLVYVSGFFEKHKARYCDLMLRVSTHGEWIEWMEFFLEAVATQAADALDRADRLIRLQQEFQTRVREKRASALLPLLVDHLFGEPSVSVRGVTEVLGNLGHPCSTQTAYNLIKRLVEKRILVPFPGRTYDRVYIAPDILRLTES